MLSREENEAWGAIDAARNAKQSAKSRKYEVKGKSTAGKESTRRRKSAPFYKVKHFPLYPLNEYSM
jgi:hypothetical protein